MIRRLLVANRSEIARRIFATCRAIGIDTVAVYSDADVDSPHVREADYAVHLPGNAPSATYLRGDLLIAAARRSGADAIHPGHGFLADSADFAQAVIDAGLTWVGPDPKVIATMGDKLAAKRLVSSLRVPTLPTYTEPAEVLDFPVLIKPAAGRGGRGLRIVRDPEALAEAVASARREAAAVFGDGTVFCEPYVERARHVEVQVFADGAGTVIALGERDCSIQRRYQKLIEECPSPAVSPGLREELCGAAAAVVRAAGHVGAGTVEFLLAPGGEFLFLEMSTTLPVEHAVTECVFGIDLVRLQLLVAEGQPLPISAPPPLRGHAMEVRLCAEDPAYAWLPSTGTLHRFAVPEVAGAFRPLIQPGLRLDSGVEGETAVGVHYDPTLAKLIAWAPSRVEAARLLAGALARSRIHGVVTNRDLLVRVLRHPAFLGGATDIGFLDRHPEVFAPLVSAMDTGKLSCLAAALASAATRAGRFPTGWRNVPALSQVVGYEGPSGPVEVGYRFDRYGALAGWSVRATPSDRAGVPGAGRDYGTEDHPPVAVVCAEPERVSLDVNGVRLDFAVHRVGDVSYVDSPEGLVTLTELPRFPLPVPEPADGSLIAPLSGAVGRVLVVPGQRVSAGDLLLTLESMTLEHPVYAPDSGVVAELPVHVGSQVDTGALLAVIAPG
ncbi:MAG: acety-l/propionyl-CoA carboxylase subunit alpha [Actinobacteria bacterium 13_1_20CM_3_71_11]|nr:MAG: acety-l/propionyl-CoA carboxylase subunit alpha [Actinobacteria bacterium 13_1_20CM_3_71_11]